MTKIPHSTQSSCRTCWLFLLLTALSALMLFFPDSASANDKPKKTVFYLNSYHYGYTWSDRIQEGISDVLTQSGMNIELQVEYLDTKKYPYRYITKKLFELYRHKYANEHFDVIIISDNNALNFILEYGRVLFPGVPVVFCGINDYDFDMLKRIGFTGVIENIDAAPTFDLALKLNPKIKNVMVVGDNSATGVAIRAQIKRVIPQFEGRLHFEFATALDIEQILNKSSKLSSDTIIYFIPMFQNIRGSNYTAGELVEIISRGTSKIACYSNWEFLLGHGIVGGHLISGFEHGKDAANLALRVLKGESAASIPIQNKVPSHNIFDYNILQKLHISEEQLPPGSTLINAPSSFYELDKELFWTIISSLIALLITLAFLLRNIARRRAVEEQIKRQLSFLELLLDTIPMLICWKDVEQCYQGVNRSFLDFFHLNSSDDILRRRDDELELDRSFVAEVAMLDQEVIRTRQGLLKHKITVHSPAGEPLWLNITKVPLRDDKGNVVGTLSISENITREVSLERQLFQSQKMEAIGTLAGGMAHDFNNILTSIINSTELVLTGLEPESEDYKDLARVLRAADRGSSVVKRILTFSRPSTEGFVNAKVADSVVEALNLVESSLPRNIVIQRFIDARDTVIYADPSQIHQVVMNLCTNSYHALRDSGGVIKASLMEETITEDQAQMLNIPQDTYLRLSIADNGPGISPEHLDKVFDPFFTTKDKSEGTGLGLAVVHGIVKGHKGAIHLSSTPWVESRIDIFLPLHADAMARIEENRSQLSYPGHEHLLFVEDDEDQLATTPRILESLGYQVTACQDPQQALELLKKNKNGFDLLLTDYDMPNTNGLDLARKAAELAPRMPVILISGRKNAVEEAKKQKNILNVVIKPYNKSQLSEIIHNIFFPNSNKKAAKEKGRGKRSFRNGTKNKKSGDGSDFPIH